MLGATQEEGQQQPHEDRAGDGDQRCGRERLRNTALDELLEDVRRDQRGEGERPQAPESRNGVPAAAAAVESDGEASARDRDENRRAGHYERHRLVRVGGQALVTLGDDATLVDGRGAR
jgi:hypothetical protein